VLLLLLVSLLNRNLGGICFQSDYYMAQKSIIIFIIIIKKYLLLLLLLLVVEFILITICL